MAEPILGTLASITELAKLAADGIDAVGRRQPEYRSFWRSFERQLKPQKFDVPWDAIVGQCWLDPTFIGLACGLIRGRRSVLAELEAFLDEFLEPPEEGRYDKPTLVGVVLEAARDAAHSAVKDFEGVSRQTVGLLEGRVEEAEEAIRTDMQRQADDIQRAVRSLEESVVAARASESNSVESGSGDLLKWIGELAQKDEGALRALHEFVAARGADALLAAIQAEGDADPALPLPSPREEALSLAYRATFDGTSRPYLWVDVTGPSGTTIPVLGLIDTGADTSCLPLDFAEKLGVERPGGGDLAVMGIGGAGIAWMPECPLRGEISGLPGAAFDLRPLFYEGAHALWGRSDLLRSFKVTLDEGQQAFTLLRTLS